MITIKELDHENMVGYVADGEITKAGIDQIVNEINTRADRLGKVRLYGEINNIGGWDSMKTFFSNMRAQLKSLGKVEKYAIVTNKGWLENLNSVADFISPGVDVNFFEMDEKEEAIAWLQDLPTEETNGAAEVDIEAENVIGLSIHGRLTKADFHLFNRLMAEKIQKGDRIRLYMEIVDLEGITLPALWEDIKAGIKYYSKIEKVAVLGRKGWLENMTKVGDFLTPGIKMKFFPLVEKEMAVQWLR